MSAVVEGGSCTTGQPSISAPILLSHANVRGTGGITVGLNLAEVDERRRANENQRHNLCGWPHAFVCPCVRLCLCGSVPRMRARWCVAICRLVCAVDRQERKQRHRGHLEVRLFLGTNRRPAHVPPLMVQVARCQGSLTLTGPRCSYETT